MEDPAASGSAQNIKPTDQSDKAGSTNPWMKAWKFTVEVLLYQKAE